ncbi:MAG: hypothetical protein HC906_00845 [Bacteroidales bacterium]|nr:hypothetical protein [Bacteroidales bacterium]
MIYSGKEEPVPQTSEDITEIRWFKKEDLSAVIENTYKTILDVMRYANLIKIT